MGSDHGGTEGHWVHLHLCVQLNIHLWPPSTQKSNNLLNLSLPSPKATVRSPRLTDYKAIRNLVMSPGKPLLPKKMANGSNRIFQEWSDDVRNHVQLHFSISDQSTRPHLWQAQNGKNCSTNFSCFKVRHIWLVCNLKKEKESIRQLPLV